MNIVEALEKNKTHKVRRSGNSYVYDIGEMESVEEFNSEHIRDKWVVHREVTVSYEDLEGAFKKALPSLPLSSVAFGLLAEQLGFENEDT